MNAEKTSKTGKAAAVALITALAVLALPLCPLNCAGADCHMRRAQGEECHPAAQVDFAQMRSARMFVCDAPALAAQTYSSDERLRKISRLSASTVMVGAMNLTPSAGFFGESGLRWGFVRGPGRQFAETRSIITLRI